MKSKLRSRWYRPNEKPLETNSKSTKNTEPFGEIQTTTEKLVDDLSNAKPITQSRNENQVHRRSKNEFKPQHRKEKRTGKNRQGGSKKPSGDSRKNETQDRNSESKDSQSDRSNNRGGKPSTNQQNQKSRRRKNKPRSEHRDHQKKGGGKSNENDRGIKKKTGLGGFISKLFGG
jgi:hypothetical protein